MAHRVRTRFLVLIALPVLAFAIQTLRSASLRKARQYEQGDYIPLFTNKVYCHKYPCEAYSYFDLPFCPPGDPITHREKSFKDVLAGDYFTNTQYELRFKIGTTENILCEKNLTREEVAKFRDAIAKEAVYEMFYDETHSLEHVGDIIKYINSTPGFYLFKHLHFYPQYQGNEVKRIKILADRNQDFKVDITEDAEIKVRFTYSVIWQEQALNQNTEENHIYIWFGLLYSLIVIMLYLRNYFTWNSFGDVIEATGVIRPYHIHSYACSCPRYSSLLGAILGVGTQQFMIICILFGLACRRHLSACNECDEKLYTLPVMINCLTWIISGYTAVQFHSSFTRYGWRECVFQTGALYFVPVFLSLAINVLAGSHLPEYYSTAIPVFEITFATAIIRILLLALAGWFANNSDPLTCATTYFQNQRIPNQPWYMKTPAQMFLGGLLPFIFIFWWMDDIYANLYNLKFCGALCLWTLFRAFICVILVTVMVGMASTYYQLSRQDNHWWWRSVFRGGSTAIFMFAYGPYFHARANAQNFMSLPMFLGYNACIFYVVFLILGTIGFYISSDVFFHEDLRRRLHANPPGELQHRD